MQTAVLMRVTPYCTGTSVNIMKEVNVKYFKPSFIMKPQNIVKIRIKKIVNMSNFKIHRLSVNYFFKMNNRWMITAAHTHQFIAFF